MRFLSFVIAVATLAGCGDDGSKAEAGSNAGGSGEGGAAEGGAAEGGASLGGASAGATLALDIAADPSVTVTCATFIDGVWGVAETGFAAGEVENLDCALVAVSVAGEPDPYWITSRTFDGTLGPDPFRHAFSTADIVIELGSEPIELVDPTSMASIFEGTLETVALAADTVEIRVE